MQRHLDKDPGVAAEEVAGLDKEEREGVADRKGQAVGEQQVAAGRHSEEQVRHRQHPQRSPGDRLIEAHHRGL